MSQKDTDDVVILRFPPDQEDNEPPNDRAYPFEQLDAFEFFHNVMESTADRVLDMRAAPELLRKHGLVSRAIAACFSSPYKTDEDEDKDVFDGKPFGSILRVLVILGIRTQQARSCLEANVSNALRGGYYGRAGTYLMAVPINHGTRTLRVGVDNEYYGVYELCFARFHPGFQKHVCAAARANLQYACEQLLVLGLERACAILMRIALDRDVFHLDAPWLERITRFVGGVRKFGEMIAGGHLTLNLDKEAWDDVLETRISTDGECDVTLDEGIVACRNLATHTGWCGHYLPLGPVHLKCNRKVLDDVCAWVYRR